MNNQFIEKSDGSALAERFAPLQLTPLMPNFGARVSGVDLTGTLCQDVRALLREAWLVYGVVIFTGQSRLDSDQHLEAAGIFGKPDLGSPFVEKLAPQVDVFTTDADRPPVANLWHSDNTVLEEPSLGTLIQIQEGPPVGGNTWWASTAKAYRCLSDNMKRYLDGLTAIHYWDQRGRRSPIYLDANWEAQRYLRNVSAIPPRPWPIVRTHPVTGEKSLYVNEAFTTYIEGVHSYESKGVLDFLYSWIRMPEFCVSHQWEINDVAVWDNIAMQHYALADYSDLRVNQRVTFKDL